MNDALEIDHRAQLRALIDAFKRLSADCVAGRIDLADREAVLAAVQNMTALLILAIDCDARIAQARRERA